MPRVLVQACVFVIISAVVSSLLFTEGGVELDVDLRVVRGNSEMLSLGIRGAFGIGCGRPGLDAQSRGWIEKPGVGSWRGSPREKAPAQRGLQPPAGAYAEGTTLQSRAKPGSWDLTAPNLRERRFGLDQMGMLLGKRFLCRR